LHELAEEQIRPGKRLLGRMPPDVSSRKLEKTSAHTQSISPEIAERTTIATEPDVVERHEGRSLGCGCFADLLPSAGPTDI
jgi:hypothetical protein